MASTPGLAFGVIADARARRRRRRFVGLLAAVAVLAVVASRLTGDRHPQAANTGSAAVRQGAHEAVLAASVGRCWFPETTRPVRFGTNCVRATRATLLAPGIVNVASGIAPHHDPWIFSLQRLRAQGLDLLCPQQTPIGSAQCLPYPGERNSDHAGNPSLSGSPPVLLTPGGIGNCSPPVWNVISGLVMRPGLSVYFATPTGTRRIHLVHVDPRLAVPGGAFAALITRGPVTLIARNSAGRTIYTTPVTNRGDKATFCNGLDGGDWGTMTPQNAKLNLTPRLITYPFGPYVNAPAS